MSLFSDDDSNINGCNCFYVEEVGYAIPGPEGCRLHKKLISNEQISAAKAAMAARKPSPHCTLTAGCTQWPGHGQWCDYLSLVCEIKPMLKELRALQSAAEWHDRIDSLLRRMGER